MYGSLIGRKHKPQTLGVIVVSSFGMWHVVNVVAVTDMPGNRVVSAEMFGFTSIGSEWQELYPMKMQDKIISKVIRG